MDKNPLNMVGRYSPMLGTEMNAEIVAMEFELFVAELTEGRSFILRMLRGKDMIALWASDSAAGDGNQLELFVHETVSALRSTVDGTTPIILHLSVSVDQDTDEQVFWAIYGGTIDSILDTHTFDPEQRLVERGDRNVRAGQAILSWVFNIAEDGSHRFTVSTDYGVQWIDFDSLDGVSYVQDEGPLEGEAAAGMIGAMLLCDLDVTLGLSSTSLGREDHRNVRIWILEDDEVHALSSGESRGCYMSVLGEDNVDDGQTFHDAWPLNIDEVLEVAAV